MSRQISHSEWNRMAASLDGSVQHHNSQQQRLFRLFQAMRAGDLVAAAKLVEEGAPLDLPLLLSEEDGGPPRAEQFRFEELEETPGAIKSVTVLGYVAGRGNLEQVEWLLRRHASISAPFDGGRDAAWLAMQMGQTGIMETLLAKGAAPNLRINDAAGTTRLIAATQLSSLDAVESLLRHKARANAYDQTGRTALHYNFDKDPYTEVDVNIGRLLIEWGGNPAAMDQSGTAAADLAHVEVQYALLRQHGLERTLRDVEQAPREPAPESDEIPFDPSQIIRPEAGDPGLPQLNKVPIFKKPRF